MNAATKINTTLESGGAVFVVAALTRAVVVWVTDILRVGVVAAFTG